jgi:hypothetical protein
LEAEGGLQASEPFQHIVGNLFTLTQTPTDLTDGHRSQPVWSALEKVLYKSTLIELAAAEQHDEMLRQFLDRPDLNSCASGSSRS